MSTLQDNYLRRPARHGQQHAFNFAIEMMLMYQRPDFGLPRTKNTVEVWHRAFQHTVGSTHVKVYRLINSIGLE